MGLTEKARHARLLAQRAALRRQMRDEALQTQVGGLHARWVAQLAAHEIERAEFKVFSQFGEDGIMQFLVQRVPIENRVFVELGVEDYTESNTRFLLDARRVARSHRRRRRGPRRFVQASGLAWRTTVDAVTAFVDRDNVDAIISAAGVAGDIGLLSIDIDGNDLWVLQAIESVSPRILVMEYNSLFGPDLAVSVPYDPAFRRAEQHYSYLYWGASLSGGVERGARQGLCAGRRKPRRATTRSSSAVTSWRDPRAQRDRLLAAGAVPGVALAGRRADISRQ